MSAARKVLASDSSDGEEDLDTSALFFGGIAHDGITSSTHAFFFSLSLFFLTFPYPHQLASHCPAPPIEEPSRIVKELDPKAK
jgi:hypothetical protein